MKKIIAFLILSFIITACPSYKREYIVLFHPDIEEIQKEVTKYLNKGYEPAGNIFLYGHEGYYQAVYK